MCSLPNDNENDVTGDTPSGRNVVSVHPPGDKSPGGCTVTKCEGMKMSVEYIIVGMIALGVLVYLVYVLLHPERL
jgi:hypothetical protein